MDDKLTDRTRRFDNLLTDVQLETDLPREQLHQQRRTIDCLHTECDDLRLERDGLSDQLRNLTNDFEECTFDGCSSSSACGCGVIRPFCRA